MCLRLAPKWPRQFSFLSGGRRRPETLSRMSGCRPAGFGQDDFVTGQRFVAVATHASASAPGFRTAPRRGGLGARWSRQRSATLIECFAIRIASSGSRAALRLRRCTTPIERWSSCTIPTETGVQRSRRAGSRRSRRPMTSCAHGLGRRGHGGLRSRPSPTGWRRSNASSVTPLRRASARGGRLVTPSATPAASRLPSRPRTASGRSSATSETSSATGSVTRAGTPPCSGSAS